ncbi:MAG: hypothetical protein ACI861_000412 [Paracoccaceae bacterium]|jgi:uncharacterized protein YggE
MKIRLCIYAVLMFLVSPLHAQEAGFLTIVGTAQVATQPDMAKISVGVEVEADTAENALKLNSMHMHDVFAVLRAEKIADRDIQTSQFSLHPQWHSQNSSTGKPPKIVGFVATNVVTIRVRDLDMLGKVLDGLTKSGANRIQGIEFGVVDPTPILDEARKLAVHEAQRKAALYADAAGVQLGAILSISEGRAASPQPNFRAAAMMADSVPIAQGELVISATVTINFSIE